MAVVGEAFIVVRAITAGVEKDIKNSMRGIDRIGDDAGRKFSKSFSRGSSKGRGPISDLFKNDSKSFAQLRKSAMATGKAFNSLQRTGYTLGTAVGVLISSLSSLVAGTVSLGAALLSAAPALTIVANGLTAVALGAITAKLALAGVGAAVQKANQQKKQGGDSKEAKMAKILQQNKEALARADRRLTDAKRNLTKAQKDYNDAIDEGVESIEQLNFDVEDAALNEKKAAIELEKAKETLARVQDLPPNSRARREAMLAYQEADLNMRQAIDRNKDLKKERDKIGGDVKNTEVYINALENMKDAEQGVLDAKAEKAKTERENLQNIEDAKKAAAASDPYAGLTASQKEFAKFLVGLKPKLDELKEAAASGFLPGLQRGIQTIVDKGFPTLKTGLKTVGTALGNASEEFAKAFTSKENLSKLTTLFENSAVSIEKLGKITGGLWGVFLSVLKAADPLLQKFLGWLDKGVTSLDKKLNADPEKLKAFFDEAGRVAGEVGAIIGNIAKGLGNIIKANTGPGTGGQIMLDYFRDITGAFKAFSGSAEGQSTLKDFFAGAAENTKAILSALGKITKEFLKLADDPNTKIFWDTIGEAAPAIGQILTNLNAGGPAFAKLLVAIADTVEILTESGGVNMFFNTLRKGVEILNKVLNNPVVKAIFKVTAVIHGFFLAIGLFATAGSFALRYMLYVFLKLSKAFTFFMKAVKIASIIFRLMWAASPIGVIILAITALIAVFVILFKKNKAFREFVLKMWEKIKDVLGAVWDALKVGIEAAWQVIQFVWNLIVEGVKLYIKLVKGYIEFVWNVLSTGLELAWTAIKFVWDLIVEGVKLYIKAITTIVGFVWDALKTGLELAWAGIKFVWDLIVSGVKLYIDAVKAYVNFVWDALKTGLEFVWNGIKALWEIIVSGVKGYINLVKTAGAAIWNFLKDGIQTAWNAGKSVFTTIINFISGLKQRFMSGAGNIWSFLTDGLKGAVNVVIGLLNFLIRAMNKISFTIPNIPGVPGRGTKFGINIPQIPLLAEGGVISASNGGTLALIGEAGRAERVEPLDPDGLSKRDKAIIKLLAGGNAGNTFNIYPSPGMDERELAALVSRQIAFQLRRGGA